MTAMALQHAARWISRGLPLLLFALAFAVRCVAWPRVLPNGLSGPILLFGTDAYYHMRGILHTLANFPATLRFDPYINFPAGGEPIWSPVFDLAIAAVALPFATSADPLIVERFAVFVPPALGAATVVALYLVARRHFGVGVAAIAGLMLCFLSGHFWYSQLGFVDHHAAVALLSTLLFGATLKLLDALERPADGKRDHTAAVLLGLASAALLLVWPGGLLHVTIAALTLLSTLLLCTERKRAIRIARASALANGIAAIAMLPSAATAAFTAWGTFSPAVLSRFQPWFFGALALHALTCLVVLGWTELGRGAPGASRAGRAGITLSVGVGVLLGSIVLFPGLVEGAADALGWLFKAETFQRVVAESRPLFAGADGAHTAEARLSRFLYLAPFAALLIVWRETRGEQRATVFFIVFWAVVLLGVTLLQRRFFNSSSVALALLFAWSLGEAWRKLSAQRGTTVRAGALALLIAIALFLFWPVADAYVGPAANLQQASRGDPLRLPPGLVRQRAFRRAALWLRKNTPPTHGWLSQDAQPAYGVLASWTHGHLIEYVARRPSIADNFGDDLGPENFLASYRYFEAEEPEATRILEQLCARYVLFRTATGSDLEAFSPTSLNYRLSLPTPDVRGLVMIYDEPMPSRGGVSRIRIFEAPSPQPGCAARARSARRADAARSAGL